GDDPDVVDVGRGEVGPGDGRELAPPLDAPDEPGEAGEQRGLVAVAAADLEDRLLAGELERLEHGGDQGRLRRDLAVPDRHWDVPVGVVRVLRGHEPDSPDRPQRVEQPGVGDAGARRLVGEVPGRHGQISVTRRTITPARAMVQPRYTVITT